MMKPEEFAPLLIEKLERLKRDQDTQEKLDRKLMEVNYLTLSTPTSL